MLEEHLVQVAIIVFSFKVEVLGEGWTYDKELLKTLVSEYIGPFLGRRGGVSTKQGSGHKSRLKKHHFPAGSKMARSHQPEIYGNSSNMRWKASDLSFLKAIFIQISLNPQNIINDSQSSLLKSMVGIPLICRHPPSPSLICKK